MSPSKNFCLNYSISKGSYSLTELLKELQAVEGILGHVKSVQVAKKGSSSSSAKKNKKNKKAPKPGAGLKQKSKTGDGKLKSKCFICGQRGHCWVCRLQVMLFSCAWLSQLS